MDWASYFDDLPELTPSEAMSKSRWRIYAEPASEVYLHGDAMDYLDMFTSDDISRLYQDKNPLIGRRAYGRGWQWFCIIKPCNGRGS